LEAARAARRQQNYKTVLIERDHMMIGDGCINVACIPTKTFIASARLVHSIRRAAEFGIKVGGVSVDWPGARKRVEEVVSEIRPGILQLPESRDDLIDEL
jgi:pyruvate/2-oxoglutarate dehydrogenase complex dihydrolipoamide dehydrogenase (E3) component